MYTTQVVCYILLLYYSHFSMRFYMSMFPYLSFLTVTTFNPAIFAEAGFVPCADKGIKQIFLFP